MIKRFFITSIFVFYNYFVYSQHLFPELDKWGYEQNLMIPDDLNLKCKLGSKDLIKGDTIDIKFYYPNKQLAIEGQCAVKGKELSFSKVKSWKYYYENGNLWTARSYTNRSGKLKSVEELLDQEGNDLSLGSGRFIGKYHMYSGYGFIYNDKGMVDRIAHYNTGQIVNTISPDRYSSKQLQRLIIREFTTSDSIKFEELTIEEAVELQKTTDKPILLNVSTSWNGWTKKGYKNLFSKPSIAKLINDNFILAYLDCEDSRDISITINGMTKEFKGADKRNNHSIVEAINGKNISATPTFLFINSSFDLEYRHSGIEIKEEMFLKFIEFYLSKEYQVKTWKEYIEK